MILVRNIRKKNLYWHHIHNNQSQKAIPQNFHQKANKIWKFQSIYKDWNPIKFFIDKSPLNNSPGDLHRINKNGFIFMCLKVIFHYFQLLLFVLSSHWIFAWYRTICGILQIYLWVVHSVIRHTTILQFVHSQCFLFLVKVIWFGFFIGLFFNTQSI